jgi:hypothetical protein
MRKCLNLFGKLLAVLLVIGLLLELSYRFYVIDFYASEFTALNPVSVSDANEKPTVLFLGDSFTANVDSYVGKLRNKLSFNLINGAISGTGVMEASFVAPSRIDEFEPDILVYQIYVGNDLLDIKHRSTGDTPFLRQVYHSLSDKFRVLKFLNYRLAQVRFGFYNDLNSPLAQTDKPFSPDSYSARQKLIFQAEPNHLENILELKNGRDAEVKILIKRVAQIRNQLDERAKLILLLIPHCSLINSTYHKRMSTLGSKSKEITNDLFYSTLSSEFPDVDILDVRSLFRSQDSTGHRLYYENDPHLNNLGQTVLAKFMKDYLKSKITVVSSESIELQY